WKGQHVWGVSYEDVNVCSFTQRRPSCQQKKDYLSVLLSSSERPAVKDALAAISNGSLMYASGAGYKILCVVQGLVDVYVLSEGSTFKWDSCAPHALLRALGGGVSDLRECLRAHVKGNEGHAAELTYHQPHTESHGVDRWANRGGIIAYLESSVIDKVVAALAGKM
ncbi:hypothetical protein M9458_053468, partial [Cirrhinus mrigala]